MNEVLLLFVSLSVSGSILALILLALKPFVKNRLSQTWQYYIWLVVILRFLLPFTPQVSVVGEMSRYVQNISNPSAVVEADPGIDINEEYTNPQVSTPQDTETETSVQPAYWRDILNNIWLVWIGVALVLFVHKVASYRSFVRFVKLGMNKITDTHIWDIYRAELAAAKVKRQLPLYENNQVVSPMLVGIVRPALVIPALETSNDELRNILRHELTHYKRLDFLYKWIVQITLCLHWFNPLVRLINKQINKSCELSCDEAVIRHLEEDARMTYGDALIASLKAQGNYSDFVVSMTMSENGNIVKERLDMIMSYKKKSKLIFCVSTLLTILLLCGFTFAGAYTISEKSIAYDINSLAVDDSTIMRGGQGLYSTDKNEQIPTDEVDAFTLDLIQSTRTWGTVQPFLPYMTSNNVAKLVEIVKPWYRPLGVEMLLGAGQNTYSNEPLTREIVDNHACDLIQNTGNWSYVKPMFPYMTADSVKKVAEIYVSQTGRFDIAQEASPYYEGELETKVESDQQTTDYNGIDFNNLPNMTSKEVDALALSYIDETGQFGYVYNMCPYMSTAGIDASVTAYLDKGGDIGMVGAMLPNMSREAARTIAQKYYKEKSNDDYDWIFKPYL